MDVILKREYSTGWIGNIEGGYGLPGDSWIGRGFLLGFADNVRVTAFGNANNINNSTMAGTGGNWSHEKKMTGDNRLIKEGVDYLFHNKKTPFKFEGNVTLSHSRRNTDTEVSVRNFIPDGDIWERSRGDALDRDFNVSSSHGVIMTLPGFYGGVNGRLEYANNKSHSLNKNAVFGSEPKEEYRVSAMDSVFDGIESESLLRKLSYRYADMRKSAARWISGSLGSNGFVSLPGSMNNVNYSISAKYRHDHYDLINNYEIVYPHNPSQNDNTLRSQIQKKSSIALNADAGCRMENIFSNGRISLSMNFNVGYEFSSAPDDNSTYDLSGQMSARQAVMASLDPRNSYWQRNTNNTAWSAVGLTIWTGKSYGTEAAKTNVNLYTDLKITDRLNLERLNYESPEYSDRINRTSNFIHPSLSLHLVRRREFKLLDFPDWVHGTRNDFKLEYKFQDSEAPITYGLDYRRSPNPLNVYLPNHNLRRSGLHSITFQWDHRKATQTMMNVYAFLNIRKDALVQSKNYNPETGVSTWMPDNISGNWDSYVQLRYVRPISRNKEFQFSSTTFYVHSNNEDYVSTSAVPMRSKVVNNYPGENISLSWQHGKILLNGGLNVEYRSSRSDRENFVDINHWWVKPVLSAVILLPGAIQLSTNFDMLQRYGFTDPNLRKAEILWNAELSRMFIKGKLMAKLKAYDILGKINPNTTVVNAQGVTETFTNTLTRYVMIQLSYSFNKNPKKKDNNEINRPGR